MTKFVLPWKMVLLLLTLGTFWGCSSSEPIDEKILGNWKGTTLLDQEAFQEFVELNEISAATADESKKQMEISVFYLSFQEGGQGKLIQEMGEYSYFEDFTWKVHSDEENQIQLSMGKGISPSGKLDITFHAKDPTFVAKFPRAEKNTEWLPFEIHFQQTDQIPQKLKEKESELQTKTPDKTSIID